MKANTRQTLGVLLTSLGALIAVFSRQIVFPGLEGLVGIETIVGKENVAYASDGTYDFTNPGAMIRWICCVALVGIGISSFGIWLLESSRKRSSES